MLTRDQALAVTGLILLGTIACLSPVHNDTWWHLAYGRDMAASGGFGQVDNFSYTAAGPAAVNHQWLSQRVFYAAWSLGGLPLLTGLCAALIVAGWVLAWHLTQGPIIDRLLVMAAGVAGSTLVWSVRPQAFTLALLPLVLTLLVRGRLLWIPPVILLWANLHGGVLLGLIALAVWAGMAAVSRSPRLPALAGCFVASALATLATPMGLRYWPEVLRSLARSQAHKLHEWQPPAWPPDHIFFWGVATVLIYLAARGWNRRHLPENAALLVTSLIVLATAVRVMRNVAPFMLVAAPTVTWLMQSPAQHAVTPHSRPLRRWGFLVGASAASAAAVVAWAWHSGGTTLQWRPISQRAALAIASCRGPLYNTYAGGGPIIWFVPGRKVFVDSRQDHFPDGLIAEATAVENGADYRSLFARYDIGCAALEPSSPTGARLEADGWRRQYSDGQWTVLSR